MYPTIYACGDCGRKLRSAGYRESQAAYKRRLDLLCEAIGVLP